MEYWFTYQLRRNGRVLRRGKGHVDIKSEDAIEAYLRQRYPPHDWGIWDEFGLHWHSTESAALKGEEYSIDSYERAMGALPPWNVQRGGGGGRAYVRCKAGLADGRRCQNDALEGNYGYCGIHR